MRKKNPIKKPNTSIEEAISNAIEADPDIILLAYGVDIERLKANIEDNVMDFLAQVVTAASLKAQMKEPDARKIINDIGIRLGFDMGRQVK